MKSEPIGKSVSIKDRIRELFSKDLIPEPVMTYKSPVDFEPTSIEDENDQPDLPYLAASEDKSSINNENLQQDSLNLPDQQGQSNIENATIETLSMQSFSVGIETVTSQVDDAFRSSPDLVGVIVQDEGQLHGVISRRKFYELLGKTFGVSIFLRRPIKTMLADLGFQPLVFPSNSLIGETVQLALKRPIDQIYDPILVGFAKGEYFLLDIYTLLLAQSNIFSALRQQVQRVNVELEKRVQIRTAELQQEVFVRRRAENMLKTRLRYEKTLNLCANVLLTGGEDSYEVLQKTLTYLINVVGSSRVFVLVQDINPDQGHGLKLINQVQALHILPIPEQLSFFPDSIWEDWFSNLWQGKSINEQRDLSNPREKELLLSVGIVSILLIPIGEEGNWIGAVGFGETEASREWDQNDIGLLNTIAQMLYSYFERRQNALALAQARDEALRASEFKSELLAKVSHELRTPLGAVLGYAQLLYYGSYGELSAEQKVAADVVINSSKYLSTLVNGILDQAQLESGQLTLVHQAFDIRQMASEVESRIRVLAESKGLRFEVQFAPDLTREMVGDRLRLEQVLTNLLGNAVKFTDKGFVRMAFRMTDFGYLCVEVSDSGMGIAVESQAKVFDPFIQVDGSPTRRYGGTGLGLSISKQLVNMMNGKIELESEIGKGSKFTLQIPIQ